MMHEAVNYNALSWVRQELDLALRQAQAFLVEYSGDKESTESLHEYAELLHQLRGPMQIAELTGADLLVAEMERVVACFPFESNDRHESALEILMQSMRILPAYLSRMQSSADDEPELLLPQVNLLRSVQGPPGGVAAGSLVLQYTALPAGVFLGREQGGAEEISARAHSARVQFQTALLAWYRGDAGKKGTATLVDVLGKLQEDAGSESEACLWWVAAGVADAVSAGLLDDSREIKQLFGQLDRQIKRLVESDAVNFGDAQTQALLNDLLRSISGIAADEGRLAEILTTFDQEGCDAGQDAGPGPGVQSEVKSALEFTGDVATGTVKEHADAVRSMLDACTAWEEIPVSAAGAPEAGIQFQEILKGISLGKDAIDDYLNYPGADSPLSSVSVVLDGVCSALWNSGLEREANVIARVKEFVCNEMLESTQTPGEEQLSHLADAICSVEFYLECLRDGRIYGNRIIESAEGHIAALGYPVSMHAAPVTDLPGEGCEAVPFATKHDKALVACNESSEVSGLQVLDTDADGEILEIFFTESDSGLHGLRQIVAELEAGNVSGEQLEEISRVFHTLKGNSRMLGAQALGMFANVFEDLVNNTLNGVTEVDSEFTGLLKQACEATAQLLRQVKDPACRPDMDVDALVSEAVRMGHAAVAGLPAGSSTVDAEQVTACGDIKSVSSDVDADYPILAADADPEIVEIYIEEAGEEVAVLAEIIPAWLAVPEQPERIAEIRRILHTLKGSGRMAGALFMGEFAWSMEDLFNRVIDGTVTPDEPFYSLAEKLPSALKQLIDQITCGAEPSENITALMAEAADLRSRAGDAIIAIQPELEDQEEQCTGTVTSCHEQDGTLLQIYTRECQEILDTIRIYLKEESGYGKVTEPLYRGLHTLAGISESAEIRFVGRLASELDRYFSTLYHMQAELPFAALEVLKESSDAIALLIEKLPDESSDESTFDILCDRIAALHHDCAQPADTDSSGHDACVVDPQTDSADYDVCDRPENEQKEEYFANVDQELFDIFEEEAAEILDASERVLHAWVAEPDDRDCVVEYQRNLHTLKGSARMMNITAIGDLSHSLETVLTRVVENTLIPSGSLFSVLFTAQDQLSEMLEQLRQRRMPGACTELEAALEQFTGISLAELLTDDNTSSNQAAESFEDVDSPDCAATAETCDTRFELDANGAEGPVSDATESCTADEFTEDPLVQNTLSVTVVAQDSYKEQLAVPQADPVTEPIPAPGEEIPVPLRPTVEPWPVRKQKPERKRGELVKVQSELLDDLVNYSGEINIYRSRMEAQIGDYRFNLGELDQTISRLREQLRKLEMETEAQVVYRYAQEADRKDQDFDPLELDRYSNLQESSRSLMESISDLYSLLTLMENTTRDSETLLLQQSRVSTDLHEGLMRTRMTPFAGLETRLKRIVRQSARQLNKKVELDLQGADGEMDRAVIERIIAPLEHMLRNAVAHGIELPGERLDKGKEESGTITIAFGREGPDIVLRISDDGAGMNVDAIREKAVEKGLLEPGVEISDSDVTQFVLQTGFTTASEVTQISGRGVGLDVVNSEVKQLGGSLHIESVRGTGTIFTIRLPYTLAINQALLVMAGADTYCVPLGNVEGVVRVHPEELLACYATDEAEYQYAGNQYQLKHLASLLNTDQLDVSQMSARVPLLLMRVADKRIALHVESLLGSREIVIKPVGMQLSSIDGISGATILGDGGVAMILDVFALSRSNNRAQLPVMRLVSQDEKRLVVMVVDDSITVRKVTTRLLERNGYKVLTAKDGVDATGQLQGCTPDIMLLDIEMPRMDGFELATHIRNDERLRHVPLVMITSRTGDKHRDRAQQIGVNYYLGKPYQEKDLLGTIDQIIRGGPDSTAVNHAGA